MSDLDEVNGVFDAIETESTAHDAVEEVNTEAIAEGSEGTTEVQEVAKPGESEGTTEAAPVEGATTEKTTEETTELSQTEESTEVNVDNWQEKLPPAPLPYQGPEPEIDPETGQITNMTPAEYSQYLRETTKVEMRQENYSRDVEYAALDAAEKILPELKTNPAVRTLVENARVASILNGQTIDTVEAAKQVRDALGIAPEALQAAKAAGAQNAKASITVQKNAALETGSAQTQSEDTTKDLISRINRGDDEAFADLLGEWEDQGKI